MADKAISNLNSTTTTSGGYVEISIPDGGGGWLSKRITHSNFLAGVSALISSLQGHVDQDTQTTKHASKSAAFTQVLGSNVKLESIDIRWISGTPSIIAGTTALASDILSARTPTSGNPSCNILSEYYQTAQTLYITVTGGTVDINTNIRESYF